MTVSPLEMTDMPGETTKILGWIERLRQGDDLAFEELLLHFDGRLERLASVMLKGFPEVAAREETGDVLQGALMRLRAALRALAVAEDGRAAEAFRAADLLRLSSLQIRRELLRLVD